MAVTEITETFTGTDGSTPSTFIAGLNGTGSSATIQSNTYRIRTDGGTGYSGAYKITRRHTNTAINDFDETFELWQGDATEKSFSFAYRADNALDGASGYFMSCGGNAPSFNLNKVTSYSPTLIGSASGYFTNPPVGTHYFMRVQVSGATHKIKLWTGTVNDQPMSGNLGDGWMISGTEATYSSGAWGFSSSIGNESTTRDFYIDNIMVSSDPVVGVADYQLTENYAANSDTPLNLVVDGTGSTGTVTLTQTSGTTASVVESPTGVFTVTNPAGTDDLVFELTATGGPADTVAFTWRRSGAPIIYVTEFVKQTDNSWSPTIV